MSKSLQYFSLIGILLIAVILIGNNIYDIISQSNTHKKYKIQALKIPKNLNFAGEKVPLEIRDVRERLDRELLVNTYWQSNAFLLIKRASKFFPILEPLLEKYGLPDDFKYLAMVESGFIDETSHAGASGLWHFLKTTGKEYGLEINDNVDERYHIEKSTEMAAKYLTKSKARFGSWTLAAAAFNAGNSQISNSLKTQQVDNYYDALLPDETERYVFRIIVLKEIITNPKKYGFVFDKEDLYSFPKTRIIKIDTPIDNIASFAKKFGMNYKEFKIFNPWLRENKLNNENGKVYEIKIPVE